MSKNNQIIITYVDRESVERNIIHYDTKHLTKAHVSEAHLDKIYHKLKGDEIRDKTLTGQISREECHSNKMRKFSKH